MTLGHQGGQLEHEADSAVRHVLSGTPVGPNLTRMANQESIADGMTVPADDRVLSIVGSAGEPLDSSSRSRFEPRFQHDFAGVRIHATTEAAGAAAAVGAAAFTVGNHIVFGSGRYSPGKDSSDLVIAHELAHVIQQEPMSGRSRAHNEVAPNFMLSDRVGDGILVQRALPVAVEALEVALTATIVAQEQAAITHGGLTYASEKGSRFGSPPQPTDQEYVATVLTAAAEASFPYSELKATFKVHWQGNQYGEMGGAYVQLDLRESTEFWKSSLDAKFTVLETMPKKGDDPRLWPMVWIYEGDFDPYGPGQYAFQGKFEIDAFGGFRVIERVVVDHSTWFEWGAPKPEDMVTAGLNIASSTPPPPQGKAQPPKGP